MSRKKVKAAMADAFAKAGVTSVTISSGGKEVTLHSGSGERLVQAPLGLDFTHGFLGEEFLLWLWFHWETEGGEHNLSNGRLVGVALDDLLVFAPRGDDEHEQTLRHGMPTRAPEARTALRQGHRVAKARVILATLDRTWTCTIDGARMTLSGVRLPDDAEDLESAQDRTEARVADWLLLHDVVGELFERFVKLRVNPKWLESEAAAMTAWMSQ